MNLKKALIIAVIAAFVILLVFFFLWVILPITSTNSGADSDNGVCSCSVDLDCGDFATQSSAQVCFEYCGAGDFHRLDSDGNGLACEGLN